MSTESKRTRRTLIAAVPKLHGQAIESTGTAPGIPDIWFTTCAVECKYLRRWPARPETLVKLDHELTLLQFRWLLNRYRDGYPCWVMLQANRTEWLLFAAPDAAVLQPQFAVTRSELYRRALMHWSHGLTTAVYQWLKLTWGEIEFERSERGIHENS